MNLSSRWALLTTTLLSIATASIDGSPPASFADFLPSIVGLPDACDEVYQYKFSECDIYDFGINRGCTDRCVNELFQLWPYVQSACADVEISPDTVIGIFLFDENPVQRLCPNIADADLPMDGVEITRENSVITDDFLATISLTLDVTISPSDPPALTRDLRPISPTFVTPPSTETTTTTTTETVTEGAAETGDSSSDARKGRFGPRQCFLLILTFCKAITIAILGI